jgi:hypothetical protein
MNSNSRVWGPKIWYIMHQIAYTFIRDKREPNVNDKEYLKNFYTSLKELLPCPSCRKHYSLTLLKYPIIKEYNSGDKIFNWTVRAHNLTNKGLKKKIMTLSQAKKIHSAPFNTKHLIYFISLILIFSENKNWKSRKVLANCLIHLIPNGPIKEKITKFATEHRINPINKPRDMTLWSKRLVSILK